MVELRLDPIELGVVSSDCYVSVRVGETQKLSKLSASRLYRFPQAGDRRYGKIEVFRRIGYGSVDIDPSNEGMREVRISCEEAGLGSLGLKVAVKQERNDEKSAQAAAARKQGSNQKVKAAKDYLAKHSLEVRLSEAMQAVLKERPEDPAEYMAQKLLGHSASVSGGVKLPPLSRGLQGQETAPMPASRVQEYLSPAPPPSMPQKSRPQKLVPLQKEVEAPVKQAPAAVVPVVPRLPEQFSLFYKQHFRSIGGPELDRLYSKFPRAALKAAAPPVQPAAPAPKRSFRHMASVGTWLQAAAPFVQPAAPVLKPSFRHLPSVGTWLQAVAPSMQPAAPVPKPSFRHLPSVGTWLQALPPPVQPAAPAPKRSFRHMASVGTWLQVLPEEPKPTAVPASSPSWSSKRSAALNKLPSVATWMKPLPKRRQQQAPPYSKRPSVGTWLVHLP